MSGTSAIRAEFGELNTDLPPWRMASGSADISTNVIVRNGSLRKRAGFSLAASSDTDVKRMIQGPSGTLYTSATDGSLFLWRNRVYQATASGLLYATASDFTSTNKGGLPAPTTSHHLTAARTSTGKLEGHYHVYYSLYNSETLEESVLSEPQVSRYPLQSRASDGYGGITVTLPAVQSGYDYDKVRIYVSGGGEMFLGRTVTYEAYLDGDVARTAAGTYAIRCPESMHGTPGHQRAANAGGEPPSTAVACFDGSQAVYSLNTSGDIEFSIPGYPTMIPRVITYSDSGADPAGQAWSWSQTVEPSPWRGHLDRAISDKAVIAVAGAGMILLATAGDTWSMRRTESSRIIPELLMPAGCISAQGAIGAASAIHMQGNEAWWVINRDGFQNTAANHWTTTLCDLGTPEDTVVAYFPAENQVWLADGGDIFIIDAETGLLLSKFDVVGIGTINAMCPYDTDGGDSHMKIASSTGIWTYDPDSTSHLDNASGFDCEWRGYFVVERGGVNMQPPNVSLDFSSNTGAGDADTGVVTVAVWGIQRSAETFTPTGIELTGAGRHPISIAELGAYATGHLIAVDITSSASDSLAWSLDDLVITYDSERP